MNVYLLLVGSIDIDGCPDMYEVEAVLLSLEALYEYYAKRKTPISLLEKITPEKEFHFIHPTLQTWQVHLDEMHKPTQLVLVPAFGERLST